MMYTVYVLGSTTRNYLYVGLTNNLQRRISQHNDGHERTTRAYRPFQVVHTEEFSERLSARLREKYLKSGVGKQFLKNKLTVLK